ncbi:myosin regulatory light chain 12B-like isoform X2 [Branchiostoma floridae]|uniref:Myosin regulatory light chain 12B-like isoform X2 n=1 Tax=Branchiostoma floridae TaxID=7739 RepID=A0A9J7KZV8_BRAFL|nr:myosin regulatory light chain 12B-like isoform X2 [Branchiostoma floridae]
MASRKAKKKAGPKQRAARATSNVFAHFDQSQIQEFKEAFLVIDANKNGVVDKSDLKTTWTTLGKSVTDKDLDAMIGQATGPINFTMFMTLFGGKLQGSDKEEVLLEAFENLDAAGTGIHKDGFITLVSTAGEKPFTKEEVAETLKVLPLDDKGNIKYNEFVRILKGGE